MSLFYTYVWRDAAGVPFYVGKGKCGRANALNRRSDEFTMVHQTGGCSVEIVDEFVLESDALALEVDLIARYGRREFGGLLVNKSDGGEAGATGAVRSLETRAKMSAAKKGAIFSAQHLARLSAAHKGTFPSAETRAKMSAARTGMKRTDETRAKMSAANTRRWQSESAREKQSKATTARFEGVGERLQMSQALKEHCAKPDVQEARSKSRRHAPPRADNTSGYKGVSCYKLKRWTAKLSVKGKTNELGYFNSPEAAARAYDCAAFTAFGTDCYLNFPDEHAQSKAA